MSFLSRERPWEPFGGASATRITAVSRSANCLDNFACGTDSRTRRRSPPTKGHLPSEEPLPWAIARACNTFSRKELLRVFSTIAPLLSCTCEVTRGEFEECP